MSTGSVPRSAYDKTGGLYYFARMLDKMRLFARGELRADFHQNLGRGADGWCTDFLRVPYEELKTRVLEAGGTDDEILEWCQERGRRLNRTDIFIWNSFASKLGWSDIASKALKDYKAGSGLSDREDIRTMMDYFDVDEGRKA